MKNADGSLSMQLIDAQGHKADLTLQRDADVIRALDNQGRVIAQYSVPAAIILAPQEWSQDLSGIFCFMPAYKKSRASLETPLLYKVMNGRPELLSEHLIRARRPLRDLFHEWIRVELLR